MSGRIAPDTTIDLLYNKFNFDKIKFELEMTKKENFYLKYVNEVFKFRETEKGDEEDEEVEEDDENEEDEEDEENEEDEEDEEDEELKVEEHT